MLIGQIRQQSQTETPREDAFRTFEALSIQRGSTDGRTQGSFVDHRPNPQNIPICKVVIIHIMRSDNGVDGRAFTACPRDFVSRNADQADLRCAAYSRQSGLVVHPCLRVSMVDGPSSSMGQARQLTPTKSAREIEHVKHVTVRVNEQPSVR